MHRCTALQNIKDQNWRNPAAFNTITLNVANWQTGYANVTRIIGVKLNTQKVSHTNSCTEIFAPFINVVVDDTLLKTIPHFNYVLLQFINIMNLLDPLLRFSTYFVVNLCRSVMLGGERSGEMNAGVGHPRRLIV